MELAHLQDDHLSSYLAVNKLTTRKTQNSFFFIAEHSGLIKYSYKNIIDLFKLIVIFH